MPAKATSQRQAHWLGMVASGAIKVPGLTAAKAKELLRGSNVKQLPVSAPPAHPKRRRRHGRRHGPPLRDFLPPQK